MDDVAVDFPDMRSSWRIRRFPGRRGDLRLSAQTAGVHRSFGLVPEVFSPVLVQYANTLLKNKVLFGSTIR